MTGMRQVNNNLAQMQHSTSKVTPKNICTKLYRKPLHQPGARSINPSLDEELKLLSITVIQSIIVTNNTKECISILGSLYESGPWGTSLAISSSMTTSKFLLHSSEKLSRHRQIIPFPLFFSWYCQTFTITNWCKMNKSPTPQ